jgi:putative tricarboxylic transport membrane protein
LLRKFDFETAPVVLGLILAPMLEMSFRQSLAMSSGSYAIFVNRPIASVMLLSGFVLVLLSLVPFLMKTIDWRQRLGIDAASEGEKL